jgi:ADP-ribosylglycohydrolase
VAQKGSNMRNFYTSKVQSVFKNLINDNKSRFHKEKRLALASILAAFLGESIGSYYEFQNYPEPSDNLIYKQETPSFGTLPGQLTDDGELALAEAFAILDSNANINFNKLAFHNGIWVISRPFDCGTTTKNSLSGIKDMSIYEKVNKEFYQWAHTGSIVIDNAMYFPKIFAETILKKAFELNYDSLSNGFLMKKSSISILSMRLVKDDKVDLNQDHIKDMSSFETLHKFDTSLTHSNPLTHNVSILYSLLYTRLIYLKIHYDNLTHKEIIVNVLSYMRGYVEGLVKTELNFFFDQYKEGKMTPESVAFKNFKLKYDYLNDLIYQINEGKSNLISFSMINNEVQGYFAISIFLIFHYLHKLKDQDLKSVSMYEIIKEIITFGGDTDTNGAICSAILGILFDPLDLVQRELLDILLNCNVLESKKQRPVIYSPGFSLFFIYFYYKMRERDYERKRDFLLNYGPQPISAAIFSLILTVGNLDDINFDI